MEMQYYTYNSTKPVNFVKFEGIFPVMFFLESKLPSTRDKIVVIGSVTILFIYVGDYTQTMQKLSDIHAIKPQKKPLHFNNFWLWI